MNEIYWPGTNVVKSRKNAFTAHLDAQQAAAVGIEAEAPRSKKKTGPKLDLSPKRSVTYKPHGGQFSMAKARETV